MKIPLIIIGLLFNWTIKCETEPVYSVDLFQEVNMDDCFGYYYFKIPAYDDDNMQIVMNVYKPYTDYIDFEIRIKGFENNPTDDEIRDADDWSTTQIPLTYYYTYSPYFDTYVYSFSTIKYVRYLALHVGSNCHFKVSMYIKAMDHVYPVKLLDKIYLGDCYGSYYFKMPAFEEDKMSIDAMVYKPYDMASFNMQISGFSHEPDKYEVWKAQWTPLIEYKFQEHSDYDTYSYPFETRKDVNYIGFYFSSNYHYKTEIYINSEKASYLVLIIVLVVVVLAIIGGVVSFILKKFGIICKASA